MVCLEPVRSGFQAFDATAYSKKWARLTLLVTRQYLRESSVAQSATPMNSKPSSIVRIGHRPRRPDDADVTPKANIFSQVLRSRLNDAAAALCLQCPLQAQRYHSPRAPFLSEPISGCHCDCDVVRFSSLIQPNAAPRVPDAILY